MSAEPTSMVEFNLCEIQEFNAEIRDLLENPEKFFGLPHFEPDDPIVYAGDETP